MNPIDVPFNTSCHFDENLRDVPDDPVDMERAARFLEDKIEFGELDKHEAIDILGLAGVYRRILGNLDEAQGHLERAVALADQLGDDKAALVNNLRLAHVYQWQRNYEKSDRLFRDELALCEQDPRFANYLDFACQHYAKSLFDQSRYPESEALFSRALQIRQVKSDDELIASSRLALEATRKRRTDDGRWTMDDGRWTMDDGRQNKQ